MRAYIFAVLVACGGTPTPPVKPEPVSPELSPALAPLNWWLGDWQSGDGACAGGAKLSEHWLAVSGAMYGVGFSDQGFEVMIVDDGEGDVADGMLRFIAMPQGLRSVQFEQQEVGTRTVTFSNPEHDDPKQITYARDGANLRAVLFGTAFTKIDFCPGSRESAHDLESADRAFNAETRAHGVDGWVAAFDPQGGMMRRGSRVEGGAAIRAAMEPLLSKGRLAWEPVASGRQGPLGFTVGKATYTGEDTWQSSYVTIWRQQPDGSWKVLFDTGRAVQKPTP
jgi:ketosteroid isomerase-like protein